MFECTATELAYLCYGVQSSTVTFTPSQIKTHRYRDVVSRRLVQWKSQQREIGETSIFAYHFYSVHFLQCIICFPMSQFREAVLVRWHPYPRHWAVFSFQLLE